MVRFLFYFQPHLYSRTRDYADEFVQELAVADKVILVELYPAREDPIEGVDSQMLIAKLGKMGVEVESSVCTTADITVKIEENLGRYSTIVCIGAGSIDAEVRKIAE